MTRTEWALGISIGIIHLTVGLFTATVPVWGYQISDIKYQISKVGDTTWCNFFGVGKERDENIVVGVFCRGCWLL